MWDSSVMTVVVPSRDIMGHIMGHIMWISYGISLSRFWDFYGNRPKTRGDSFGFWNESSVETCFLHMFTSNLANGELNQPEMVCWSKQNNQMGISICFKNHELKWLRKHLLGMILIDSWYDSMFLMFLWLEGDQRKTSTSDFDVRLQQCVGQDRCDLWARLRILTPMPSMILVSRLVSYLLLLLLLLLLFFFFFFFFFVCFFFLVFPFVVFAISLYTLLPLSLRLCKLLTVTTARDCVLANLWSKCCDFLDGFRKRDTVSIIYQEVSKSEQL